MEYKEYSIGELLDYEQPSKYIVSSTDYNDKYRIPVLTAGKTFIIGYTNETEGVFDKYPVIIFDDFTTATQLVNFKFKVKSSAMKILKPRYDWVNIRYMYYLMQSIRFEHSTHKRYWLQHYSKIKIQIPSSEEQKRIVSRIEELFSELDNGVENLKKAKAQLDVYRRAVLKEAFDMSDDKNTTKISNLCECIRIGPFGTMLHKSDYIINGIAVINPQHIKNGEIIASDKVTISEEKADELSSYRLKENDVIMGRRGEMGRTAPVLNVHSGFICGTGSIFFRLKPEYDAVLYSQILSSPNTVNYLEKNATGTTMKNLNEDIVKNIVVPCITKDMQIDVQNKISENISICENIEKTIDTALQQAETMRQSILKQAFEGRL